MAKKQTTLAISTGESIKNTRVELIQADTPEIIVNLTTDGSTAFDLTGYTALLTAAKDSYGWTVDGVIASPTTGQIVFSPTATQTATAGNHRVDISITHSASSIVTTIYLGCNHTN